MSENPVTSSVGDVPVAVIPVSDNSFDRRGTSRDEIVVPSVRLKHDIGTFTRDVPSPSQAVGVPTTPDTLSSLVRDETGKISSARVMLWLWTLSSLALVVLSSRFGWQLDQARITLLATVEVALVAWAALPRMAQHLFAPRGMPATMMPLVTRDPHGKRDPRLPSRDDDERGL